MGSMHATPFAPASPKRVSILLSCWGADALIGRYVDALLCSGIVEIATLIVVDFPHSHRDPEYVRRELSRYPDVIYSAQTESLSLYEAWNIGIGLARTEFVGNLNLDDRVTEDYYRAGVTALESTGAHVFSSAALMTDEIGNWHGKTRPQNHLPNEMMEGRRVVEYDMKALVHSGGGVPRKRNPPHCAPIWRRRLHETVGYFDCKRFDFCADFEFWLRAAERGCRFILLNDAKTLFYSAPGTASDRLLHDENAAIIDHWESTFPPAGYRETHLGRRHDLLHHCMNMNVIFSRHSYYAHLSDIVSIVVIAHDQPALFEECLASVRSQDYALFDCIMVLDAASDDVVAVAKRYQQRDARFRLVRLERRSERNYARNVGITLAIGRWVCFVDGDDHLTKNSLSSRVSVACKDPEAIVFGGLEIFNADGFLLTNPGRESFKLKELRTGWPHHCTVLLPLDHLNRHRLGYPASPGDASASSAEIAGEDVQFLIDVLKARPGGEFKNCGSPVYRYRRHASSSYSSRHISIGRVVDIVLREFGLPDRSDEAYARSLAGRLVNFACWCVLNQADPAAILPRIREIGSSVGHVFDGKLYAETLATFKTERMSVGAREAVDDRCLESTVRSMLSEWGLKMSEGVQIEQKRVSAPTAVGSGGQTASSGAGAVLTAEEMRDFERLVRFKNRHAGAECLLLCNGPSLKKVDFSRIDKSRFKIIGLNKIYLGFEMLGVLPDYIVAVNRKVIEQSAAEFSKISVVKFISNRVDLGLFPPNPMMFHLNTAKLPRPSKRFNTDIVEYVNEGWTVTHAALQIAYYMGFEAVHIVGMDHRFSQHVPGQENKESVIKGDDVDHFHAGYFGHGQTWDFPDLRNSEISYQAARKIYEESGRRIFDCTIDGACEVFEKRGVESLYTPRSSHLRRDVGVPA